ncbi:hypothetical protein M5689_018717 [Euphorbia peplus]|nr:hypothetical protein M5689_018717 [Euphorbia peplus]
MSRGVYARTFLCRNAEQPTL